MDYSSLAVKIILLDVVELPLPDANVNYSNCWIVWRYLNHKIV